jgi:hypothetical protein
MSASVLASAARTPPTGGAVNGRMAATVKGMRDRVAKTDA